MAKLFQRRNLLGSLLFLILVGEVTVGFKNGLFTPGGLVVLLGLYFFYFLLLESLVAKYRLSNMSLVLINFALYSVLITGLFHGEIADYVTRPDNWLITTLIRIQCSFYPLFAFYILNKIAPRTKPAPTVQLATTLFLGYILLLTPSKNFGFIRLLNTAETAPVISVVLVMAAILALVVGLSGKPATGFYKNRAFKTWSWLLLGIGLIPGLPFFMLLLLLMIFVSMKFLSKPEFRAASVA